MMKRPEPAPQRFVDCVVAIMAYCKKHGLTAHTTRKNPLEFRKKIERVKA